MVEQGVSDMEDGRVPTAPGSHPTGHAGCAVDGASRFDPSRMADRIQRGEIKALSVRQPWCHHILYDGKDVENRDWATRGRGWVLLHASKSEAEDREFIRENKMPLGAIVGIMRITDCVTSMESRWFCGKYGFVLADQRAIEPVTCKGQLGFFVPPDDVLAQVAALLRDSDNGRAS